MLKAEAKGASTNASLFFIFSEIINPTQPGFTLWRLLSYSTHPRHVVNFRWIMCSSPSYSCEIRIAAVVPRDGALAAVAQVFRAAFAD